ncbi:hypothetical protein ALP25_05494 [Pseudomonas syringae pv. syringae]|nr:hypothetical protein ALP25_05494 [Pseudomonas syringae pv. syringae]
MVPVRQCGVTEPSRCLATHPGCTAHRRHGRTRSTTGRCTLPDLTDCHRPCHLPGARIAASGPRVAQRQPARQSGSGRRARLVSSQDLGKVALRLEPGLAITCTFLRQQHVHHFRGGREIIQRELHQAPGVRVHGGFAQLRRVHLTQALESGDLRLATFLFSDQTVKDPVTLGFVQRVVDFLAQVDPVQRRHGDVHMPGVDQRAEVLHKQRTQQRRNVQTVRVGVGQDADLAITQLADIGCAWVNPDGHGNVVDFLTGKHFAAVHFPGVEDFAAQRQDRLEFLVASLLGGTAGRITLDQKQFGACRVLSGTVGQFARQRRPLGDALALDLFACLEAPTGVVDRQIGQLQAQLGVRVEPQAERILDHTRDEGRRFTGRQTFFGLPGELRLLHFHRQDEGNAFPDVFRGQLHTARQQVAELAELAHGIQQALAQTVHVGAALRRRDQVDVAFLNAVAPFGQPEQRPVDRFLVTGEAAAERLVRQAQELGDRVLQVGAQAVFVMPLDFLAAGFVFEADQQTRAQNRLGLEHMLETADRKLRCIEILRIGGEINAGPGVALANGADDRQFGGLVAVSEGHFIFVAITLDPHPNLSGQRVDHGNAHAVQAAGELIVLVGKLAACVKLGEDQLDAGHAFFRVDVHRHAAAVVGDFERIVGMKDDLYRTRVPGQGFVDAVVDDFLSQVVGPRGVGVHARTFANRIEAREDFDGVCVIRASAGSGHGFSLSIFHGISGVQCSCIHVTGHRSPTAPTDRSSATDRGQIRQTSAVPACARQNPENCGRRPPECARHRPGKTSRRDDNRASRHRSAATPETAAGPAARVLRARPAPGYGLRSTATARRCTDSVARRETRRTADAD